jgi:hypothetical protein
MVIIHTPVQVTQIKYRSVYIHHSNLIHTGTGTLSSQLSTGTSTVWYPTCTVHGTGMVSVLVTYEVA